MKSGAVLGVAGLALLLFSGSSAAQGGAPVQLVWQAPANCPQAVQVRQKVHDLLGKSAREATPSRLRAEGRIEATGDRFRLTLDIHYDLVNATRVVDAVSCEDLGGVAAITLALLFRAEHSSGAPLTERDLGGASTAVGAQDSSGDTESRASNAETRATSSENRASSAESHVETAASVAEKREPNPQGRASESGEAQPSGGLRFTFRVPELRADVGVLPDPNFGLGLAAGLRHHAWRFLASGTFWLAQDHEAGPFLGYGAHFGRVSGELSGCRGFRVSEFELAPCLLLSLDDVSARGTGVGISSTSPQTAWLSVGAGLQGLWSLSRGFGLVFGVSFRVPTSRPHFVSEGIGEIFQVGPVALGIVLGCEWRL